MTPRDASRTTKLEDELLVPVPRPDPRPGKIYDPGPIDWEAIFGCDRPLRVEVGVGKADFIIQLAQEEPEFNYVGFEYSVKRVEKFLKKVHASDRKNIRMVSEDVRYTLPVLFQPESVDHFFLLFPDPWPKNRHAKNRFAQKKNLEIVLKFLKKGGGITMRTDSPSYAYQMVKELGKFSELKNLAAPLPFVEKPRVQAKTLFQMRWEEEGRPIFFIEFEKTE